MYGIAAVGKLKSLLNVFVEDGYRAVALSQTQKTDIPGLIFNFGGQSEAEGSDIIELYYNFALPDIIFLHMDLSEVITLSENLQADIVIKLPETRDPLYGRWEDSRVLCLNESAEALFLRIKGMLQ